MLTTFCRDEQRVYPNTVRFRTSVIKSGLEPNKVLYKTSIKVIAKLNTVINNSVNVSRYEGTPPASDASDAKRKIPGGPIYPEAEMMALAQLGKLNLWTKKATRDAAACGLDTDGVAGLLATALQRGRYLGAEWCVQKPGGPWAACDAYLVVERKWNDAAHKELETTFYLKCAISKTGSMLLSASNHPEGC